jgi:hypothetical protein
MNLIEKETTVQHSMAAGSGTGVRDCVGVHA